MKQYLNVFNVWCCIVHRLICQTIFEMQSKNFETHVTIYARIFDYGFQLSCNDIPAQNIWSKCRQTSLQMHGQRIHVCLVVCTMCYNLEISKYCAIFFIFYYYQWKMIVRVTVTNQFNYCQSYDWMEIILEWKMLELSPNPINDWIRIILNISRVKSCPNKSPEFKTSNAFLISMYSSPRNWPTISYWNILHNRPQNMQKMHNHSPCRTLFHSLEWCERCTTWFGLLWFGSACFSLVGQNYALFAMYLKQLYYHAHHSNDAQIVVGVCILYGGFTVFARISNLLRTNCFNNIHFQFMISTTSVG